MEGGTGTTGEGLGAMLRVERKGGWGSGGVGGR